jgi:uncharacterized membrane protein YciS (DUF1049 family)
MWKLKLLVGVIFLLAIATLGMVINSDNTQIVSPSLFGYSFASASLGIWLFLTLLAGGILGYLVSLLSNLKSHGQLTLVSRKLRHCEKELAQLRTNALRD